MSYAHCPKCGYIANWNGVHCPFCGRKLQDEKGEYWEKEPDEMKSIFGFETLDELENGIEKACHECDSVEDIKALCGLSRMLGWMRREEDASSRGRIFPRNMGIESD